MPRPRPEYLGKIDDKRDSLLDCYKSRSIDGQSAFWLQGTNAREEAYRAIVALDQRLAGMKRSWEDGFPSKDLDGLLLAADHLRQAHANLKACLAVESTLELGR